MAIPCPLTITTLPRTQCLQDFRPREWFVPEGSWLLEAFRVEDRYFGGSQTQIDIYTKTAPPNESYFDYQV